ncbi:MAG: RagB/SusD family nutrient uptake outer membrane protein [Flavobacteriaceae bacterium]
MKKSILYIAAIAISFVSCTDNFESINTNPNGISNESLQQMNNHIGGEFEPMFLNVFRIVDRYQLQQNLNGDLYSGYMATPTPFRGGINNTNYSLVDGWNSRAWEYSYVNVMPSARNIENTIAESGDPSGEKFVHLSNIIKVAGMHRVSDVFGPIRYTKYNDFTTTGEYDSQETVYNAFFEELGNAITFLADYEDDVTFVPFDMSVANGDIATWRSFANSLRLRLAIRVSKVDAALAKTQGELALASDAGFIENSFKINTGYDHPINIISDTWGDIRMGAMMESILTGYNDKRIEKYFLPATDATLSSTYKGIRNGIDLVAKTKYLGHSAIGEVVDGQDIQWMTAAEVHFLKAEAALRGWSGAGTAKDNYEAGVKASFTQYGIAGVDDYLADSTSTPMDYVDELNATYSIAYASDVKIAYDDTASNEAQLEQIITQKWIAMFPDGMEAWSEFRRTGYPKVFPVAINNSGGTIDTDIQIRRLNFPDTEVNTNNSNIQKAIEYLGGADNGGTRLWWDTGAANF